MLPVLLEVLLVSRHQLRSSFDDQQVFRIVLLGAFVKLKLPVMIVASSIRMILLWAIRCLSSMKGQEHAAQDCHELCCTASAPVSRVT